MSATPNRSYLSTDPTDPPVVDRVARDRGLGTVVVVLLRTAPTEWLRSWSGSLEPTVVDLTGENGSSLRLSSDDGRVAAGLSPTDLTGVGMVLDSLVERHGRTMVYFESLTGLTHCAGSTRTARFLRRVVERVTGAGGTVVADVEPDAHPTPDLRLLSGPFDRLVRSGTSLRSEPPQP